MKLCRRHIIVSRGGIRKYRRPVSPVNSPGSALKDTCRKCSQRCHLVCSLGSQIYTLAKVAEECEEIDFRTGGRSGKELYRSWLNRSQRAFSNNEYCMNSVRLQTR